MEDNKMLIEEMISRAEKSQEPGEMKPGQVVHEGDSETPTPMVLAEIKSAGYVYIYDTITGERSLTNRNMLPAQLKKKREDGSLVFTTIKPNITPKRGILRCMLHPGDPSRELYNQMGLAVCPKSNLTSPFQVKRHMEKRHRMEWQTLEDMRLEAEREETRKEQRLLREALIGSRTGVQVETPVISNQVVDTATEPEMYVAEHPYKSRRKKR